MPVEFLSGEQAAEFGRFAEVPAPWELARVCACLTMPIERFVARHRTGCQSARVRGAAGNGASAGTFLPDPLDVPWPVVTFLTEQLGVADPSSVKAYTDRAKTPYEHQWEIVQAFG